MNPDQAQVSSSDYQIQVWIDGEKVDEARYFRYEHARWFYDQARYEHGRRPGSQVFVGLLYRPTGDAWPMLATQRSYWVQTYQS